MDACDFILEHNDTELAKFVVKMARALDVHIPVPYHANQLPSAVAADYVLDLLETEVCYELANISNKSDIAFFSRC